MMNAAVAPFATTEDLSDIENGTDDDHSVQYAEINPAEEDIVISVRRSASRIRGTKEGWWRKISNLLLLSTHIICSRGGGGGEGVYVLHHRRSMGKAHLSVTIKI